MLEALQLRMFAIATSFSAQDGLCQESFSPQRYQTLRIEIAWM